MTTKITHDATFKVIETDETELDRCPDCGQTPEEGACFYCKMD